MKKTEIESHAAWKYISGLSNYDRYHALTGSNALAFEKYFSVRLEQWSFTRLSEIPTDYLYISVVDPFRNMAFIMVIKPA